MTAQIIDLAERRAQAQQPLKIPRKAYEAILAAEEALGMAHDLMDEAEEICRAAGVRLPPSRARSYHQTETTN